MRALRNQFGDPEKRFTHHIIGRECFILQWVAQQANSQRVLDIDIHCTSTRHAVMGTKLLIVPSSPPLRSTGIVSLAEHSENIPMSGSSCMIIECGWHALYCIPAS